MKTQKTIFSIHKPFSIPFDLSFAFCVYSIIHSSTCLYVLADSKKTIWLLWVSDPSEKWALLTCCFHPFVPRSGTRDQAGQSVYQFYTKQTKRGL